MLKPPRRNLEDARSAASKAADHIFDAKQRLAALREDEANAGCPEAAFISRLASGAAVDVLELDRPGADAVRRLTRRNRSSLPGAMFSKPPKGQLMTAKGICRSSNTGLRMRPAMLSAIPKPSRGSWMASRRMQDEVARRRGALQFLTLKGLVPEPRKAAVAHLLRADFDSCSDTEWQSAFDAFET